MGRAHQIHGPAHTPTGAQATDERSRQQADLAGRLGLGPTQVLDAVTTLYGDHRMWATAARRRAMSARSMVFAERTS